MRTACLWLALLFCASLVPCIAQFQAPPPTVGAPKSPTVDEALLTSLLDTKQPEIRFRPQDVISVSAYGLGNFLVEQRVERDGTVRFPFLGKVQVASLTVAELEEKLEEQLKDRGILKEPQVTVTAVTQPWAVVTVAGDVEKPGVFPAYGNLTLMDYLSLAGGLQDNLVGTDVAVNSSASSVVTLIRSSLGHSVSIPLGADPAHSPWAQIPLIPGDQIRVGRVGMVYAVGAFKTQGAFPLKNNAPTTVIQLMAMAGGIGFEGIRKDAHIIRTNGTAQYVLDVNVGDILKGKTTDIALEPNDILFVPTSEWKAAIKGGGSGVIVSLADSSVLAATR
jgi:polysaccharide export outer membrane protein